MKNVSKFLTELIFTVLVAGIGSGLLAFVLLFIVANFGVTNEWREYINFSSGVLFGLIVGYKLKILLAEQKVSKKK
jgi:hypothetical protein